MNDGYCIGESESHKECDGMPATRTKSLDPDREKEENIVKRQRFMYLNRFEVNLYKYCDRLNQKWFRKGRGGKRI